MKMCDFDPMRTRAGISTSEIHFIISKTVSAGRADATEVPIPRHKSSSTNGLPATGRYKVDPNLENQKNFFFRKQNYLDSTMTRKIA